MSARGKLIYALVARGKVVLAEHASSGGNFIQVSRVLLEKILDGTASGGKMSYENERFVFHYDSSEGIVCLCMSDVGFSRRNAFAFLADVKTRFLSSYSDGVEHAMAFEMNEEFSRVLSRQMDYFSDPAADGISRVQSKLDETKTIMRDRMDAIMDRGEKVDLLVHKTDALRQDSLAFANQSGSMKWLFLLRNVKLWVVLILLLIVMIWLLSSLVCGFDYHRCKG